MGMEAYLERKRQYDKLVDYLSTLTEEEEADFYDTDEGYYFTELVMEFGEEVEIEFSKPLIRRVEA